MLSYRKLVVGHPFRFQIRVLRREHIHFADIGTPETFGYRCFQCISIHRTVGNTGLGNPFAAEGAVVLVTYTGIETHLIEQLLLHDDVSGSLAYGFVHQLLIRTNNTVVPCMSAPVLIVDTHREEIARKQAERLVQKHPVVMVVRTEKISPVHCTGCHRQSVVYLVVAPVVECTDGTAGITESVFQRKGGGSTQNIHRIVADRCGNLTGVLVFVFSQTHIAGRFEAVVYGIAQFGEAVGDLEFRIGTMTIGTVVVKGYKAAEPAHVVAVVYHVLLGIVRAIHHPGLGRTSLLMLPAGDDVYHPSHSIGSV